MCSEQPNNSNGERSTPEQVTVQVWSGDADIDDKSLLEDQEPDEYTLSPINPFGPTMVPKDMQVTLMEDTEHHGKYAFSIPSHSRPATLNICTNKTESETTDWNPPIAKGLTFTHDGDYDHRSYELWGKVMMYISPTN